MSFSNFSATIHTGNTEAEMVIYLPDSTNQEEKCSQEQ